MQALGELKLDDCEAKLRSKKALIKKRSPFPPCQAPRQTSLVVFCCKPSRPAPRVSCTLKITTNKLFVKKNLQCDTQQC